MQRLVLGPVLAALLVGGALAQEPPPPASSPAEQPPEVVFGTEVDYVEVDALVTDAQGDVVSGLTRDDFQVFEEGLPREIATFAEVALPVGDAAATPGGAAPGDTATNEAGLSGRIYAIVLDDLQVHARRSGLVREIASQFVEENLEEGDVAAVFFTGGGRGAVFTGDKRLLREAIGAFEGRKTGSATLERLSLLDHQKDMMLARPSPTEDALTPRLGRDRDPSDLERVYAARIAMDTLELAARAFAGVHGRRKAILLFSEGIDFDTFDAMGEVQRDAARVRQSMEDAIAVATRYNAAVYGIDPRGPVSVVGPDDIQLTLPAVDGTGIDLQSLDQEVQRSLESLRMLSRETGGFPVLSTNDFARAYELIVRANSRYYLLGYFAQDFRPDGAYRRIEVRVRRPGVRVVARDGYVRPRAGDTKRERPSVALPADTSLELVELLGRPLPEPGLPLAVSAAVFRGSDENGSVAVTIEIPGRELPLRQESDHAVNQLEITLIAIDASGAIQTGDRLLVQPRLSAGTRERVERSGLRFVRRLALPPGRYQLRVAAREAELGQRGSVFYDLAVPDYGERTLAMSGILLTSRGAAATLTPSIDAQLEPLLATPPTVARRFASGDVVSAYFEVYPEADGDTTVTARVTDSLRREVFRASAGRQDAPAAPGRVVEIPLEAVGPGRYQLQIEARRGLGQPPASRELSFEVVPDPPAGAWADTPVAPGLGAAGFDARVPAGRVDRLEAWLESIEAHEPGTADAHALMVRLWSPPLLAELAADVATLVRLVGDPGYPVLWLVDPSRPGRPRRAPYTTGDETRLRSLAREAAGRCATAVLGDTLRRPTELERRCARNRLLKRGALLHTDAAVRFRGELSPTQGRSGALRLRVRFSDGQQLAREDAPGHWELAQALLDNVAPTPREDEAVRLWYLATCAYGQYHERHTRQEDRAVELFPEDAQVLFLAGSVHENFASPRMQLLASSMRLPWGTAHGIESERSELRKAEALFRRALQADPALVEARIRLGRVLHLLGRHEQALRLLQQAAAARSSAAAEGDEEELLLYFAEMFQGAAAEAVGRQDLARASYRRAAEVFPGAPAPHLAQSQLALRNGDRGAALDAARRAMRPRAGQDRDDPWWRYHVLQGRRVDDWFERLHESLGAET